MVGDNGLPAYSGFINNRCVTIAEVLRGNGYQTYMSGKWHVGGQYIANTPHLWTPGGPGFPTPRQRGFDTFYGTLGGAGSYFDPPPCWITTPSSTPKATTTTPTPSANAPSP